MTKCILWILEGEFIWIMDRENIFYFFWYSIMFMCNLSVIYWGDLLRIILLSGPVLVILLVFKESKYNIKIFFTTLTSVVIISGLILGYIYLFMPISTFNIEYYVAIAAFLFYFSLLVLSCIYKDKIYWLKKKLLYLQIMINHSMGA